MCYYYTPQKLHSYKPETSDLCFRCGTEVGSFLHCTWQCIKVRTFWYDICDTLAKIIDAPFPLDPELCLLGNFTTVSRNLRRHKIKFIEVALGVARTCIATTWKSDSPFPLKVVSQEWTVVYLLKRLLITWEIVLIRFWKFGNLIWIMWKHCRNVCERCCKLLFATSVWVCLFLKLLIVYTIYLSLPSFLLFLFCMYFYFTLCLICCMFVWGEGGWGCLLFVIVKLK